MIDNWVELSYIGGRKRDKNGFYQLVVCNNCNKFYELRSIADFEYLRDGIVDGHIKCKICGFQQSLFDWISILRNMANSPNLTEGESMIYNWFLENYEKIMLIDAKDRLRKYYVNELNDLGYDDNFLEQEIPRREIGHMFRMCKLQREIRVLKDNTKKTIFAEPKLLIQ